MQPKWLIQNYSQEEFDKIKSALELTKTPYQEVPYKSILDSIDKSLLPKTDECVIIYGSLQFVKALSKLGVVYTPGTYGLCNTDCSVYMPKLPEEYLLNYPYLITSWEELKRSWAYYNTIYFESLFIKPNSGNKIFPGQTIPMQEWNDRVSLIEQTSNVVNETLVLVSERKIITENEYRFVIANKKVITGSMYNWDKDCSPIYPKEAEELAQKVADLEWQLDTIYTCDIAMSVDGPKVIELNSFSCAGLYDTDRHKIITTVNQIAVNDYDDVYGNKF